MSSSLDEDLTFGETITPNIITVNAGGTIFQTYQETLTRGSAYFQAYFHGGFSKPDPRKVVFLDMDPECFRHLLLRMRLPGCDPSGNHAATLPGLREAAAFLGVELPPTPEEKKRMEYEAYKLELGPVKSDIYELAVRLQKDDHVEIFHKDGSEWRMETIGAYNPSERYCWNVGSVRKKYLYWENQPQIRVTDAAERAKILARAPDLTRVVFPPK